MMLVLISMAVIGLVVAAMAIGVMAGRQPIKGSCGGLGAVGVDSVCEICGGDPNRCDGEDGESSDDRERRTGADLYYRADQQ